MEAYTTHVYNWCGIQFTQDSDGRQAYLLRDIRVTYKECKKSGFFSDFIEDEFIKLSQFRQYLFCITLGITIKQKFEKLKWK